MRPDDTRRGARRPAPGATPALPEDATLSRPKRSARDLEGSRASMLVAARRDDAGVEAAAPIRVAQAGHSGLRMLGGRRPA